MTTQSRVLAACEMLARPAAGLDPRDVVESAAEQLSRLIRSERALVLVQGPEGVSAGSYPGRPELDAAISLLEHFHDSDGGTLARSHALASSFPELRQVTAASFTASGGYRGVAAVMEPLEGQFSALDEWLLLVVARRTAAHLDLVTLHQERLADAQIVEDARVAGELQRTMLPYPLPGGSPVDVAGVLRPARVLAGDFYDWHSLPRATTAVVADVSGKGAAAALLTARLHSAVRSGMGGAGPNPAEIMVRVQRDLAPVLEAAGRIVTVAVAALDHEERQVRIASAGHSPIVLSSAGSTRLIHPESPPLGVADFRPQQVSIPLEAGDRLVVSTDGVIDQRSPEGATYGIPRLLGRVAGMQDMGAAAVASEILADVERFSAGQPQDDDQAIIVMQLEAGEW